MGLSVAAAKSSDGFALHTVVSLSLSLSLVFLDPRISRFIDHSFLLFSVLSIPRCLF